MYSPAFNPLVYPTGMAPGFDPTHIASAGINNGNSFSTISSGLNHINLLNGLAGTVVGTITNFQVIGLIGPATYYNTSLGASEFSLNTALTPLTQTYAAIAFWPSFTAADGFLALNGQAAANTGLCTTPSGNLTWSGATLQTSGLTLTTNTPYFVACSTTINAGGTGPLNFIAVNLSNGQLRTAAITNTDTSTAALGTGSVSAPAASGQATAYIAAALYSSNYQSLATLTKWGLDPWSFWYPRHGNGPDMWRQMVGSNILTAQSLL